MIVLFVLFFVAVVYCVSFLISEKVIQYFINKYFAQEIEETIENGTLNIHNSWEALVRAKARAEKTYLTITIYVGLFCLFILVLLNTLYKLS